jgi:hypothetical protein
MSLAKTNSVDVVALLPGKKTVALIAYDGGEVPQDFEREQAMQKKLQAYLEFVMSGQFARTYPEHAERKRVIQVVCLNPPTEGMKKVKGIRDHDRQETFIPVEVKTDAEFRAAMAAANPAKQKPWWRFW